MKKLTLALLSLIALVGCEPQHHRPNKPTKEKVVTYKVHVDNDWIYYYILYDSMSRNYYYTSSPSPITTYTNVNWSSSSQKPVAINEEAELVETQEVAVETLGEDFNQEIVGDYAEIAETDNSLDSMEGVPDNSDNSSDTSSSDSSSFDSGSSDSGGGDSGGGGE